MALKSFRGGVHPLHGSKERTAGLATVALQSPDIAVIPMVQHIGAPCVPCVKPGDRVLVGQAVGEARGFVSAPVHTSVSGTVKAVTRMPHTGGIPAMSVIIENDGLDEALPPMPRLNIESASREELLERVRLAGIVGMGGATFPTHVKLAPPETKKIDAVILNAAECEPYLSADHRLLLERPGVVADGLMIAKRILGAQNVYVGIEDNKRDAAAALEKALNGRAEVVLLRTKYPQGSEKQLIEACTGRQVPSGGLPMDAGCVALNAGTPAAIADAVVRGLPLTRRVVTVSGPGISKPANLLCRIGTPLKALVEFCGGSGEGYRLVSGGPMMGWAQHSLEAPVIKGTSGVLLLPHAEYVEKSCIRCGQCVQACPMRVMPLAIAEAADAGNWERAERLHALDCMECGACTYICPARREVSSRIRVAKRAIMAQRKANQS